jgi:hypothetical protein
VPGSPKPKTQLKLKLDFCVFLSGLFSFFLAAAAWRKQKTGQPERRKSKSLWPAAEPTKGMDLRTRMAN